ncbi:MAG: hypothetical protein C4536_00135 [Actinobacteria bacterium]|jgi:hypothetical protein|nr:MAG: hypothetical protein C4536_00135 [Actinomycetota bacterium]
MAVSSTQEKSYTERMQRINGAIELRQPDRVPIFLAFGLFPARYAGMTYEEAFFNLDGWLSANQKAIGDFEPDLYFQPGAAVITGGAVHETLQNRQLRLPGRELPPDVSFQFVEGEYMTAEEYDAFLTDPSDFAIRTYLPRVFGALEGLGYLPTLKSMVMGYAGAALSAMLSLPPIAAALDTLARAGEEAMRWTAGYMEFEKRMDALGFPAFSSSVTLAPFDLISDMLRGMRGAMLDMYRCPDKLIAAQEMLLPTLVDAPVLQAQMSGNPRVFIPLHRGADGFMSVEQFERFYWPGFRDLVLALIDAGLTPCPFFEGTYDQRLQYLRQFPPGKVAGIFDRSDLFKAKEIIGDVMCISGDMPLSLLQTGTPEQVREYAKKLIDVVGKGGGFIMNSNTVLDEADPGLLRVWVDFTREYGVYA